MTTCTVLKTHRWILFEPFWGQTSRKPVGHPDIKDLAENPKVPKRKLSTERQEVLSSGRVNEGRIIVRKVKKRWRWLMVLCIQTPFFVLSLSLSLQAKHHRIVTLRWFLPPWTWIKGQIGSIKVLKTPLQRVRSPDLWGRRDLRPTCPSCRSGLGPWMPPNPSQSFERKRYLTFLILQPSIVLYLKCQLGWKRRKNV